MKVRSRLAAAVAVATALLGMSLANSAPAQAVPQGNVYSVCASSPLPYNHVVSYLTASYGPCYNGVDPYSISYRFALPTGADAVGKQYEVCTSTVPISWNIIRSGYDHPKCGFFYGGNAMTIRYNG